MAFYSKINEKPLLKQKLLYFKFSACCWVGSKNCINLIDYLIANFGGFQQNTLWVLGWAALLRKNVINSIYRKFKIKKYIPLNISQV